VHLSGLLSLARLIAKIFPIHEFAAPGGVPPRLAAATHVFALISQTARHVHTLGGLDILSHLTVAAAATNLKLNHYEAAFGGPVNWL
jgi:hypothetical protein